MSSENNPYAVGSATFSESQAEVAAETVFGKYYVVAPWKFLVLHIVTFGLYNVMWMFLQWSRVKRATKGKQWPIMRALFPVFFFHSLLDEVEHDLRRQGDGPVSSTSALSTFIVLLMVSQGIMDRVAAHDGAPEWIHLLVVGLMIVVGLKQQEAQRLINRADGDPQASSNSRLTVWNALWILAGIVLWTVYMFGLWVLSQENGVALP